MFKFYIQTWQMLVVFKLFHQVYFPFSSFSLLLGCFIILCTNIRNKYGHQRAICGSFFLSFSRSQVVNFLKWKHHFWVKTLPYLFLSNNDLFTQYVFLNKKRCHLMTFSWRLESKRARGNRNHKFRAILAEEFRAYLENIWSGAPNQYSRAGL